MVIPATTVTINNYCTNKNPLFPHWITIVYYNRIAGKAIVLIVKYCTIIPALNVTINKYCYCTRNNMKQNKLYY